MTRLTAADVVGPEARLRLLDEQLMSLAGVDLAGLALNAAGHRHGDVFAGVRMAAVPITTGLGLIGGFCDAVAVVLRHLGCDAFVTDQTDVRGIDEAARSAAEVFFVADDACFVALNVMKGRSVDNDSATAWGYVAALAAAAGTLEGRDVLLLGLGPVGLAAAERLMELGAEISVVEPDRQRLRDALMEHQALRPVPLAEGLVRCDFVFDATPQAAFITESAVRASTIAAVPGLPSGFTAGAQTKLGMRHVHDPLAIGVAVMAALALS